MPPHLLHANASKYKDGNESTFQLDSTSVAVLKFLFLYFSASALPWSRDKRPIRIEKDKVRILHIDNHI